MGGGGCSGISLQGINYFCEMSEMDVFTSFCSDNSPKGQHSNHKYLYGGSIIFCEMVNVLLPAFLQISRQRDDIASDMKKNEDLEARMAKLNIDIEQMKDSVDMSNRSHYDQKKRKDELQNERK